MLDGGEHGLRRAPEHQVHLVGDHRVDRVDFDSERPPMPGLCDEPGGRMHQGRCADRQEQVACGRGVALREDAWVDAVT